LTVYLNYRNEEIKNAQETDLEVFLEVIEDHGEED
jgi:hypothetical protein